MIEIERLTKELSLFSQAHVGYSISKIMYQTQEEKEFVSNYRNRLSHLPDNHYLLFAEDALSFLDRPYIFDSLCGHFDAGEQRGKRTTVFFVLNDYTNSKSYYGRNLTDEQRQFYKSLHGFACNNRLRRGKMISFIEAYKSKEDYFEGVNFKDDTNYIFNSLISKEFHKAPEHNPGFVYDYLTDPEKTVAAKYFSKFLQKFVRDVVEYSEVSLHKKEEQKRT